MDEYAKGVTMDFCRWVLGRIDVIYRPIWKDAWEGMRPTKGRIENEIISDDDLYQQYIESLNNQSKI
jgi:hypothetical protein